MSDATVLTAKHAECSLGIIYSVHVFQFKLLTIWRPRNLGVCSYSIILLL